MATMAPVSRIGGQALAALLPDVHLLPGPVYGALRDGITALVLDGRVAPETRLPSERDLAAALRISRATVTAAYDALRAGGYLASRTGSGSFVTVPPGSHPRPSLARWSAHVDGTDVIDLSCAALAAPPGVLAPAVEVATGALPRYTAEDGYDPSGLAVLRAAVAARFCERGVPTSADQILVTNGALHGLDLLLRLLAGPGERVLTDLPTYPGALDAIRAHRARTVPVPLADGGDWHVEQLSATLRQAAPRLAYLVPDYQNPTGALMDETSRRAVLSAARRAGTVVVVDETFVGLGFGAEAPPPCAALDPNVITVGSLSKPVWGGLRIGWIRAGAELIGRLAALRASIDLGGSVLDQLVATELIGRLDEILAFRAAELLPRRDALLAALGHQLPGWRASLPAGGLSMWIELDAPLSTSLTLLSLPAGVAIVPGSRFGVDGTLERFLRLPYSLPPERLAEAVRRIAGVWAQLREAGAASRQLVVA
jgi:DNA-binding transcriptional MocR family regulator